MSTSSVKQALQGISFLQGIDEKYLEQIAGIAHVCDFEPPAEVFHEGQAAEDVYLVVSGKLALELTPSTAYRKQLVRVGRGEMLGWSSLVEHPHYAATAVVVEPTRLVRIDGRQLRAICDHDPQFGYEFMRRTMRSLAKRLTATWTQLSHLYVSQFMPVSAPLDE